MCALCDIYFRKQNMAEASSYADDWELCKENVQPLRQGRSFMDMSAAIQPSNATRIKQEQEYACIELHSLTHGIMQETEPDGAYIGESYKMRKRESAKVNMYKMRKCV